MRKLKWGVLGTGNIVAKAGRGLQLAGNAVWHGVAGRNRENSRTAAERFGVSVAYDGYQELIDDPEIDAVYIALLNHLHMEWAVKACEAGKHVLVEKPFAMNVQDALRVKAAAERNGVLAAEAFVWKYHPAYDALKERIRQGAIGTVAQFFAHFSFVAAPESTRWKKEWGGGSLYDVGCYPVSWSRFFMDAEPEAVEASMVLHPEERVDKRFAGTLYFPGGRVAQISSAFDMRLGSFFEILGTERRIAAHMKLTPETMTIVIASGDEREEWPMDRFRMFALQAERFGEQVLSGGPHVDALNDALAQAKVIEALMEAAHSGKRIEVG